MIVHQIFSFEIILPAELDAPFCVDCLSYVVVVVVWDIVGEKNDHLT